LVVVVVAAGLTVVVVARGELVVVGPVLADGAGNAVVAVVSLGAASVDVLGS
jgi:hypothetical protein